jgi:hypothetical protein
VLALFKAAPRPTGAPRRYAVASRALSSAPRGGPGGPRAQRGSGR